MAWNDDGDIRFTGYLGAKGKGIELKRQINQQVHSQVRFRGSPSNFIRYCIEYTLSHDASLTKDRRAA